MESEEAARLARSSVGELLRLARERGIDVERWFMPVPEGGDEAATRWWHEGRLCRREAFERRLTGLGLGLAAGASEDVSQQIEAALSRESIERIASTAAARVDDDDDAAWVAMREVLALADEDDEASFSSEQKNRVWRPEELEKQLRGGWLVVDETSAPRNEPTKGGNAATRSAEQEFLALVEARRDGPELLASLLAAVRRAIAPNARSSRKDRALEKRLVSRRVFASALAARGLEVARPGALLAAIRDAEAGGESARRHATNRTRATFGAVRAYFWRARARLLRDERRLFRRSGKPWDAWVEAKNEAVEAKETQFRRALAGLDSDLDAAVLDDMLRKYKLLEGDALDEALAMLTERYVNGPDGRFDALRLASRKPGTTKRAARREVALRERRRLADAERREAGVTRLLWAEYAKSRAKPDAESKPFAAWLREAFEAHDKVKTKVGDWVAHKRCLAKRAANDAKRAAPASVLESELRSLVSMCDARVGDHHEPSRKGLDLERRLRHLRELGVVTRADFQRAFGSDFAFSLLADPKTAAKALKLADIETRDALHDRHHDDNNVKDVFDYDTAQAARDAAAKLDAAKQSKNDATFRIWKAHKSKLAVEGKARAQQALTDLERDRDLAKHAAKKALTAWRKAQNLVRERKLRRRPNKGGCDAIEKALALRHQRYLAAKDACRVWRDLDRKLARRLQQDAIMKT